jgi:FMN phosphatase YigB (HAD superfamily)
MSHSVAECAAGEHSPQKTRPKFLYFDLGQVLLNFDVELVLRQMAAVAGIDPGRVAQAIFASGLQARYEAGAVSSRGFYEEFCRQTGAQPDYDALAAAGTDIFTLNVPMLPVVAHLREAGYRMGVLSNTCEKHWEHCLRRYAILQDTFDVYALSYEIGAVKPEAAIYRAAAEKAACSPEDIFFTDDVPGHVEGARAFGFDAVPYTSTPRLVAELRARAVRFNY